MKNRILTALFAGGLLMTAACATPPDELVQARETYKTASENPQVQSNASVELREAKLALDRAEKEFDDEGNEMSTRALSYVAEREARLAMIKAANNAYVKEEAQKKEDLLAATEEGRQNAKEAYKGAQVQIFMTKQQLDNERKSLESSRQEAMKMAQDLEAARASGKYTEQQLADREKELALKQQTLKQTEEQLKQAEAERARLEQELTATQAKLSEFAQVAEKQDNMVITLNGSVLFKTGESTLMPIAQQRLAEVASVLKEHEGKKIVVQGHTDSQGSDSDNMALSQARAQAVSSYLITQGVPQNMISAQGMGETMPIASNDTAEGRANNRRVEIIISRQSEPVSSL